MAIDYSIAFDCAAKQHFGEGNSARGLIEILERLKARNRAAAFRQFAREQGQTEADPTMIVQTQDERGNVVQKEISVAELETAAQPLDAHASACAGCPANVLQQAYGCFGAINYPVSQAGESWLFSRMQPPDTMGAQLCGEFVTEFSVKGERIRQLRKAGLFELKQGERMTLKKSLLKTTWLSSDQLLESILLSGEGLEPSHCFGILIWLGAIRVDGVIPTSLEDTDTIQKLMGLESREAKEKHTRLEIGPKETSEAVLAFQCLVTALYLCWVHDVPLYISA